MNGFLFYLAGSESEIKNLHFVFALPIVGTGQAAVVLVQRSVNWFIECRQYNTWKSSWSICLKFYCSIVIEYADWQLPNFLQVIMCSRRSRSE